MTENKEGEKLVIPEKNFDLKSSETVKFIPENDSKNGLSPVSFDTVKTAFTGLTKEELMKYVNDPFWVRVRWVLFILFWLIWLIMLLGAILIIIVTPKCQEPSTMLWWQRSPLYTMDIQKLIPESSTNNNSLIDILKNKINYLKELGIESVLLKSVLFSKNGAYDEVLNFTNVDYNLQSVNIFHNEIINYAKSKGIHIILSFVPNYSGKNDMFIRSSLGEEEYKDYYIWYKANYSSKPEKLPNNWLSVYDTPAWEWDDIRKQFYLHQFNATQPDFNFRNPNVVDFFSNVLKFWMNLGISGFHLDKTEYLLENNEFEDENVGRDAKYNLKQYGFYTHSKTFELPENTVILDKWSKLLKNNSNILIVSGGILDKKDIANFVLRPILLSPNFSANEINEKILRWKNAVNYPTWEWKCSQLHTQCYQKSVIDALTIVTFFLPGIPVMFDEGFVINEKQLKDTNTTLFPTSQSHDNILKKLIEMRKLPAFSFGDFISKVLNETIYTFVRVKQGTPGYLVAWNLSKNTTTINFEQYFPVIPEDLILILKSNSIIDNNLKDRIPSSKVEIPSMAAYIFSFVPNLK